MWLCVPDLIHNYPSELVFSQDRFKNNIHGCMVLKCQSQFYVCDYLHFFTARLRSHGKVMFSLVSVCLWFTCDHYAQCIGPYCTGCTPGSVQAGSTHPSAYWNAFLLIDVWEIDITFKFNCFHLEKWWF